VRRQLSENLDLKVGLACARFGCCCGCCGLLLPTLL
jgi:hypothetical protein